MAKLKVTDFVLYRWRYTLGSLAIGVVLFAVLFIAGLSVPGGTSEVEMDSTVQSANLSVSALDGKNPDSLVHLPYHALQRASIELFGIHPLAIKLPSLALAFASALFIFGVLNLWFRRNVAVIATIIVATSGAFLLQAQLGTPDIMYLFWTSLLLFSSSMIAQARRFKPIWTVFTAIAAGMSLYSPFALYALVALGVTTLVHPHARFVVLRQPKKVLAAGAAVFLVVIAPLIIGAFYNPSLLLSLAGIPNAVPTLDSIWASLLPYVSYSMPSIGLLMTPIYSLVVSMIVVIGLFRLFTAKYTAKSYILTVWTFFTVLIVALADAPTAVTFVPIMLLVAFGIDYLIRSWYKLFPHNPYARVAGLIPLGALLFGITTTGIDTYVSSYRYSPEASAVYTKDLRILRDTVEQHTDTPILLLVDEKDAPFYSQYASYTSDSISVTSDVAQASGASATATIISTASLRSTVTVPTEIVVSDTSKQANRFYLYKNGFN